MTAGAAPEPVVPEPVVPEPVAPEPVVPEPVVPGSGAAGPVTPDTRYVVGLDIGDGESCLVWMDTTDPQDTGTTYERRTPPERSVLTALARRRDTGDIVFGEAALLAGDAVQFVVNVKNVPTSASLSTPDVVLFAQAFLDEFFRVHPHVREDCQVLVGYPTGWPEQARDAYQRFLATSEVPLSLLPESQSALVHVWDLRSPAEAATDPSPTLDVAPAVAPAVTPVIDDVLVVDVGSSTVDFTMVTDLQPTNLDLGSDLGCRDIDRMLARLLTESLGSRPDFRAAMAANDAPMLLALACRRAKEAQFSGHPWILHDHGEALDPRMAAIFDLAAGWLRGEDIPFLVETGWAVSFRHLLDLVRERLPHPPAVLVVTGGGSRMPVVGRVCREVFPEAEAAVDDLPSFSVARGLASAGRHRVRALRFRRDAAAVAASAQVRQVLRETTVTAFTAVKEATLAEMERTDPSTWLELVASPPGLQPAAERMEAEIDGAVRPLVEQVCRAYHVPLGEGRLRGSLAPQRLFTVDFINRVTGIRERPDFEWETEGLGPALSPAARVAIPRLLRTAGGLGAASLTDALRRNLRAGGKIAVVAGLAYVGLRGGIWLAQTANRTLQRRAALAFLMRMQLPDEAVTAFEDDLSAEIRRIVEASVAPLERMVL